MVDARCHGNGSGVWTEVNRGRWGTTRHTRDGGVKGVGGGGTQVLNGL